MLRLIYKRYKRRFLDFFLEDMLQDIPKNIQDSVVLILADKKKEFTNMLYWQAHTISRRDPTDFINMERKLGMLTQVKLLLTLVGSVQKEKEEHPVVGETIPAPPEWQEAVSKFKKRELLTKPKTK